MKILHTSDSHGFYREILKALEGDFDLWIDSGDFFPNKTRGDKSVEVNFQTKWFGWKNLGERIVKALSGRTLISISGNHDFVSLAKLVSDAGGNAFDLSEGSVEIDGQVFAGFSQIPFIVGEWNGEVQQDVFSSLMEKALESDPTILVTHVPPAGIMDEGWGSTGIINTLTWAEHNVHHHFFGHIHGTGGHVQEEMGIFFYNGGCKTIFHEI